MKEKFEITSVSVYHKYLHPFHNGVLQIASCPFTFIFSITFVGNVDISLFSDIQILTCEIEKNYNDLESIIRFTLPEERAFYNVYQIFQDDNKNIVTDLKKIFEVCSTATNYIESWERLCLNMWRYDTNSSWLYTLMLDDFLSRDEVKLWKASKEL